MNDPYEADRLEGICDCSHRCRGALEFVVRASITSCSNARLVRRGPGSVHENQFDRRVVTSGLWEKVTFDTHSITSDLVYTCGTTVQEINSAKDLTVG